MDRRTAAAGGDDVDAVLDAAGEEAAVGVVGLGRALGLEHDALGIGRARSRHGPDLELARGRRAAEALDLDRVRVHGRDP